MKCSIKGLAAILMIIFVVISMKNIVKAESNNGIDKQNKDVLKNAYLLYDEESFKDVKVKISMDFSSERKNMNSFCLDIYNNTGDKMDAKIQLSDNEYLKNLTEYNVVLENEDNHYELSYSDIRKLIGVHFLIRILDGNANVIFNKPFYINNPQDSDIDLNLCLKKIGILSDGKIEKDNLFEQQEYYMYGNIRYKYETIRLLEEDIDDNLFDNYEYIIISNYDTKKLASDKAEYIKKYVTKGGNLIIGTGKYASKTLAGLDNLFSYEIEGYDIGEYVKLDLFSSNSSKYESLEEKSKAYVMNTQGYIDIENWNEVWSDYYANKDLEKYYNNKWVAMVFDENNYESTINMEIPKKCEYANIKVLDDYSQYGNNIGEYKVIAKGLGKIYLFKMNVLDKDITLDLEILQEENITREFGTLSSEVNIYNNSIRLSKYLIFGIIYIIVISFGIYIGFRKIKRRIWIWPAIVGCGIVFTFAILIISKNEQIDDSLTYATVKQLDESGMCKAVTSMSIANVSDRDYEFNISSKEPIELNSINSTDYYNYNNYYDEYMYDYYSDEQIDNHDVKIQNKFKEYILINNSLDNNKTIKLHGVTPYTISSFSFENKEPDYGYFKIDKENDSKYLINNTDKEFECVIVSYKSIMYYIEKIAAHEKVCIDDKYKNEFNQWEKMIYKENIEDIDKANIITAYTDIISMNENNNNIKIYAVEGYKNELLGDEWRGISVVYQNIINHDDIIKLQISDEINSSRCILTDDYYIESVVFNEGKSNKYISNVQWMYKDVLVLYSIPKDVEIKKIGFEKNDINEYICRNSTENIVMLIYNYETNKFEQFTKLNEYKTLTDVKKYYGDDRPIRMMIKTDEDMIFPQLSFEVE